METPYEIALKEFDKHIKELKGFDKNNPEILKYNSSIDSKFLEYTDEQAWCAKFVGWCVMQARFTGCLCPPETRSMMARSWELWGFTALKPKEGDIVVLLRGEARGPQGHVGFYVHNNLINNDYITVLGGNQHDSVSKAIYERKKIVCFKTY